MSPGVPGGDEVRSICPAHNLTKFYRIDDLRNEFLKHRIENVIISENFRLISQRLAIFIKASAKCPKILNGNE